ncbi:MAG: phosphoribosylanthranilate isomerase, partial [Desulfobulbaceae bacterium]|nr:phosphoribosylanthranilate isomerase [Desulfobulbaceae bacterium]
MNVRTRIKVCGMTNMTEAAGAVAAGVDALGFIFVKKSPRNIEPDKARIIVRTLPPFVDAVGVFMDEEAEVVDEIVQYCGLTMVQLHGSESPEYCKVIST